MSKIKIIFQSGLAGAMLSCYALVFYHWQTAPAMLQDGQYVMVFMLSCPVGWFLGSTLATIVTRKSLRGQILASLFIIIVGTIGCIPCGPVIGGVAMLPIGLIDALISNFRT